MATQTNTRNGQTQGFSVGVGARLGWPQERFVAMIILVALGLLILIRLGFRGVGISLGAQGRVNV